MLSNTINKLSVRIEAGSINTEQVTGVGYYTESLIEAISELPNVDVDVFALGSKKTVLAEHLTAATIRQLKFLPLLNHRIYRKLHQYFLAPPCDISLPDIDVTIFPDFALWPTTSSRINGVAIHDLTFIKHPHFMRSRALGPFSVPVTTWYLRSVVRRGVRHADFIITVSESVKSELISLLHVPKDRILVTPIPPRENFKRQAVINKGSKNQLLGKYKIPTKDYILSVGTIEPRKNYLALISAYLRLPHNIRSSYSLVIAGGEGWGCTETLRIIRDAQKAGENIVLTGYFDTMDAYQLYSHAAIFSSASHYEGFGMPLLEAMCANTPIVASDIPVFREVAGDAALYIDPSDVSEYSSVLHSLLESVVQQNRLVARGKRRLRSFSWQDNANKIEAFCRDKLARNSG